MLSTTLGGRFDLDALNESIQENEARMAEPGFWDDQAAAQKVIDENNVLKGKYDTFKQLADEVGDLAVDAKDWDLDAVVDFAQAAMVKEDSISVADLKGKSPAEVEAYLMDRVDKIYADKAKQLYDAGQMLEFEKVVILRVVDSHWTDHIDAMDQLRQSIGLRGYGQLNPLVEYQRDGYQMFEEMVADIDYDTTRLFMKSEIRQNIQR
ncbi:hypothetical protein WP50_24000 [Lactiplantibacillus plantarum]|nr:hypothetical protein WP50_24000 [Lactiplantibacillus plantarum]